MIKWKLEHHIQNFTRHILEHYFFKDRISKALLFCKFQYLKVHHILKKYSQMFADLISVNQRTHAIRDGGSTTLIKFCPYLWDNELSSKETDSWQGTICKKWNRCEWVDSSVDISKSLEPFQPSIVSIP